MLKLDISYWKVDFYLRLTCDFNKLKEKNIYSKIVRG